MFLLTWIISCVQEFLETLWKGLFPEELLVLVLINELPGSFLNVEEVLGESLESSIKDELIFDLNQVITALCVESYHQPRDRNEIINDLLQDIFDSVLLLVGCDSWVKDDLSIL